MRGNITLGKQERQVRHRRKAPEGRLTDRRKVERQTYWWRF